VDVSDREETVGDRLRATLELFEFGVELMRASLRRRHPGISPHELDRLLEDWLAVRPGAEGGDGPGIPVPLARFR